MKGQGGDGLRARFALDVFDERSCNAPCVFPLILLLFTHFLFVGTTTWRGVEIVNERGRVGRRKRAAMQEGFLEMINAIFRNPLTGTHTPASGEACEKVGGAKDVVLVFQVECCARVEDSCRNEGCCWLVHRNHLVLGGGADEERK